MSFYSSIFEQKMILIWGECGFKINTKNNKTNGEKGLSTKLASKNNDLRSVT
jgi:hypothetical protein